MNFKDLFKNRITLSLILISIILILIGVLLIYLNVDSLSYPLILHFNDFQGVDQVGDAGDLWSIALMAGVLFIMNLVLSTLFYMRERVLSYIILSVNVFISIVYLIAVSNIISLN